MKAVRIESVGQIGVGEAPEPSPAAGEALVEVRAGALNHRDVWILKGQYAGLRFPCIPGSDGSGVVTAVGPGADPAWVGRDVVVNPGFDWGPKESAQGAGFSILGLPRDGTLAERVAVPVSQLAAKPEHLDWVEAAALPLAGLTAWRALFSRARLRPSDRVLVTGIGGGVALFALQFAAASGSEVWVTSSSDEKIAKATAIGARGGYRYDEEGWAARAASHGLFDVIVDSAGGAGFNALLDVAAPGARIVLYGATRGAVPEVALRKVFWKQLSLLGSTMGSPSDWSLMTSFVALRRLVPVVSDVFALDRAPEAFALMERGGQFGKVAVRM